MQVTSRPARACKKGAGSYCEFLLSDSDGSDLDKDDEEVVDESERYDPATQEMPTFDKKRGDINWVVLVCLSHRHRLHKFLLFIIRNL